MKKLLLPVFLLAIALAPPLLMAQEPVVVAVFPFKNVTGEVAYDSLAWSYADSLEHYLGQKPESGTVYQLISVDDIRDQMLAQNIDVKSPSYEGDVWTVAEALGAKLVIWGTYIVKYDKANIEVKVYNTRTLMHDRQHTADRIRVVYGDALTTVTVAADKILPALHP